MARIDHSIFFQQKTPEIFGSAMEGMEQGMRLSDMAKQREYQAKEQEHLGWKREQEMKAAKEAAMDRETKEYGRIFGDVKDQAGWDSGLAEWGRLGYSGLDRMPKVFDQGLNNTTLARSLSYQERLAQQRQAQLDKERQEDRGTDKRYKNAQIANLEAETAGKRSKAGGAGYDPETFVPGVGVALTSTDAKALKDSAIMKQKLDSQVQEMIDLRKAKGTEFMDRAAVARGQQLSKDILLTYKNLQKLGVLSASDEAIINAIIPSDPLEMTISSMTGIGQDPILSNLTKFKEDNQRDYDANLAARLRPGQQAPQVASAPRAAAPTDYSKMSDAQISELYQQRKRSINANAR